MGEGDSHPEEVAAVEHLLKALEEVLEFQALVEEGGSLNQEWEEAVEDQHQALEEVGVDH